MPDTYGLDASWKSLIHDLGLRVSDVLRRAGLPEDLLEGKTVRLLAHSFYRFWSSLEAEVKDDAFPLRYIHSIRTESFSPLLFAALCSPHLQTAASRIRQYKSIVAPMKLEIVEFEDTVQFELVWPSSPEPVPSSLVMTDLIFIVHLARVGTRELIQAQAVYMYDPPEYLQPFEAFLGCSIRKGQQDSILLSKDDVYKPFLTSNEWIWSAFEPQLRERLADLTEAATTTERVRAVLLEALPGGFSKIDAIARKLAMSRRTLQRRLHQEQTSYQQVLQSTRNDLAYHYLLRSSLSIEEIAFLLAFEEPNSFRRAFSCWTGKTPESTRRDLEKS